ncbi:hypothetical protein GCWU000342_00528 [Shuttleworthella satelles DSM 14600]|uniref:Uncharacterized protein n=1 Tax=Shuttleworthella satelles DSM 14600 TaxID=626523 RepID=C4G977_9FIRM|nr:hypothetical protein GCWU000342_00528 [Shuttleworthia satelles DSM 14600]
MRILILPCRRDFGNHSPPDSLSCTIFSAKLRRICHLQDFLHTENRKGQGLAEPKPSKTNFQRVRAFKNKSPENWSLQKQISGELEPSKTNLRRVRAFKNKSPENWSLQKIPPGSSPAGAKQSIL